MRVFFGLVLAMLLSACATGYSKSGIFGGYWNHEGPGELVEVGFNGNGYIKGERVEIYLLYRSAEIAKERGKAHFTIYHTLHDAIIDKPLVEVDATAIGGKPYGKVFMLLHDSAVPGALNTEATLARYRERVKGSSTTAPPAGARKS